MLLKFDILIKSVQRLFIIKLLFIVIYSLITVHLQSQVNKNGIPLIKNYSPEDYKANSQNWAIVQDNRGLMYFANNFGLLQYDGSRWKLFTNEKSSELRSLAVDKYGEIYYGANQDFGVMIPDSIGNLKFKSIYRAYNADNEDFSRIWNIKTFDDFVFFQSNEKIFRLKIPFNPESAEDIKKKMTTFVPEKAFHWSFNVYNKFYVREYEKGMMVLENNNLKLIQGGEKFANEKVYTMLPYGNGKILIGSRESGLYLYDPKLNSNAITKFECKANEVLIESILYGGIALPNNQFAFSTLTNGVIIIDDLGNVVEHLNEKSGLPDQQIYSIFSDNKSGNLWFVSGENGVFNANIGSPFREWNRKNGLNGVVADIVRFKNLIYVATGSGVFYLDESKPGFSAFEQIADITYESWDLQIIKTVNGKEDILLAGTGDGIFEIKGNKASKVLNDGYVYQLSQSNIDPNKVYIGYGDGFGGMEFNKETKKWKSLGKNKSIGYSVLNIFERANGKIYLGTLGSGILLLNDLLDKKPMAIDSTQGLEIAGSDFKVYQIDNDIIFATQKGLFLYNEKDNKVVPYRKFGNEFSNYDLGVSGLLKTGDDYWMGIYYNNPKGPIWEELIKFKPGKNGYTKDEVFAKIIPQKLPRALYDDNNFIWVANDKGLYKFDKSLEKNYNESFNVNIFRVTMAEDSVLFQGSFYEIRNGIEYFSMNQPDQLKPVLSYQNNQIAFEYSASFYELENLTEYSYRLIGSNDKWSKWTTETKFPFTNLSPNSYRFEIRAKNIYGTISKTASFEFTVLPPWYLTWWAYISFFVVAVFLVWSIVKLNIRRLEMDKIKLEGIIDERTAEIRQKNATLQQQKEEITAQRDEIEIQKDQVTLQKDQIEEQKKNITDSILYASKIQEALLPPEPVLDELLPEHFILWKPRDIVSGDFYWTSKKNNKTILVAADCTGHGVPGAFMSMLGISYLNEIMNKFEDIRANQILDELKASVKAALRQTGKDHETKDGMDMALCMIDFENMEMEYAGAYNSLLLIRDNKIIKYDADRMPIGIHIKERDSFTNHIIEMKKGDNFYIYSDGYIDQFGGEKGNKLMAKRFKELLLENHPKSLTDQKVALEKFLVNWQSYKNENGETYKQLDDILVIGVRI